MHNTRMITSIPLQFLSNEEKETVLLWRNHEKIRKWMVDDKVIELKEHLRFIENLKDNKSKEYRLVYYNNIPLGIINLVNIHDSEAELGLYKNPFYCNKERIHVGRVLMESIYSLALELCISKLTLRVKQNNRKAIELYKDNLFRITCIDRGYVYMSKQIKDKVLIIGEMSANHNGDINVALDTIKAFSKTGIDAIKIQTYTADTMTLNMNVPPFIIDNNSIWDGSSLYELYKEAYTPWEWYDDLKICAENEGLQFFSTPFDTTAVDFLKNKDVPYYKIASFELTDIPLIEYTASLNKPMIMSTGIATKEEIREAVAACRSVGNREITLLHCISSYPATPEEFNLRTMVDMKDEFGTEVGLSDHSLYNEPSLSAVSLGAKIIEKHIILDRNMGGPDATFSIQPNEMKSLVNSIRITEKTIGQINYDLSEKKESNRKFSRSLFAVKDIKKGESFSHENVRSLRPSEGLAPKYLKEILDKKSKKDILAGTPISWDLLK